MKKKALLLIVASALLLSSVVFFAVRAVGKNTLGGGGTMMIYARVLSVGDGEMTLEYTSQDMTRKTLVIDARSGVFNPDNESYPKPGELLAVVFFTGFGGKEVNREPKSSMPVISFRKLREEEGDPVLFQLAPSDNGVKEFLRIYGEVKSPYDDDTCRNVTPGEISDRYGFEIFKFDQSCAGYLLYENRIYPLGESLGGLGLTSFAVADIDRDGSPEVYFTYSWGSGMHRSMAGYFDTRDRAVVLFDYSYYNGDMLLVGGNNSLSLCEASVEFRSFTDMTLRQGEEKLGDIVSDSGEIRLITLQK